jgi:hypothetical protein
MERARVRTRPLLPLQRGFEGSRLEGQLVATAYELAVPIRRQSLAPSPGARGDEGGEQQPPATTGGFSA